MFFPGYLKHNKKVNYSRVTSQASSYRGNLTLTVGFEASSSSFEISPAADVVLVGNGVSLHWTEPGAEARRLWENGVERVSAKAGV